MSISLAMLTWAKQPAGMEKGMWISSALSGRDTDVPLEGAHGHGYGSA